MFAFRVWFFLILLPPLIVLVSFILMLHSNYWNKKWVQASIYWLILGTFILKRTKLLLHTTNELLSMLNSYENNLNADFLTQWRDLLTSLPLYTRPFIFRAQIKLNFGYLLHSEIASNTVSTCRNSHWILAGFDLQTLGSAVTCSTIRPNPFSIFSLIYFGIN